MDTSFVLCSCVVISNARISLSVALLAVNVGASSTFSVCSVYRSLDNLHPSVFTSLRVHAINQRNWWWTALVLFVGLVSVVLNIVSLAPYLDSEEFALYDLRMAMVNESFPESVRISYHRDERSKRQRMLWYAGRRGTQP